MGMAQQLNYVVVEPLYFSSALKKGGKKTQEWIREASKEREKARGKEKEQSKQKKLSVKQRKKDTQDKMAAP